MRRVNEPVLAASVASAREGTGVGLRAATEPEFGAKPRREIERPHRGARAEAGLLVYIANAWAPNPAAPPTVYMKALDVTWYSTASPWMTYSPITSSQSDVQSYST